MKRAAVWIVTLGVILAGNLLLPSWYARDLQREQNGPRSRADVLLDVLGEARTVLARMLWFKMDLLHEQLEGKGVAFDKEKDLIPYLRLITLLDHHVEEAYDNIAYDLYKGNDKKEQAHQILDEGLSYNPNSPLLLLRKGLFLNEEKKWSELVTVANQGLAASTDSIDQRNFCGLGFHAEEKLGHKQQAEHYLRLIFALEPGSPRAVELWKQLNGVPPPQDIQYPGT